MHLNCTSEPCVSHNRPLSLYAMPPRTLTKPIIVPSSSPIRTQHLTLSLRFLSVVSTSIYTHRRRRSSPAGAHAFEISFAPTETIEWIPRLFCMPLNVRQKLGKRLRRVLLFPGERRTCLTRHGSQQSFRRLAAWRHSCPACTVWRIWSHSRGSLVKRACFPFCTKSLVSRLQ